MVKTYRPDYRKVIIRTSVGEIIEGNINITSKERVSDIFTKSENPFIVLTEVLFKECRIKTLIVNKNHIIWAEPIE
ncbi:MAG: hypothetical protein AB1659_05195 [Thermodesulfobacteriota bacterium]